MRYFSKEIPSFCFLPDGRKIFCDFVDEAGVGHISTATGYLVSQIDSAIRQGIGGWRNSDEQNYLTGLESAKKNSQQLNQNPNQRQRKSWFRADPSLARKVAGSVGKRGIEVPISPRPDPIRVPTPEQMKPRKGPIPKEAFI